MFIFSLLFPLLINCDLTLTTTPLTPNISIFSGGPFTNVTPDHINSTILFGIHGDLSTICQSSCLGCNISYFMARNGPINNVCSESVQGKRVFNELDRLYWFDNSFDEFRRNYDWCNCSHIPNHTNIGNVLTVSTCSTCQNNKTCATFEGGPFSSTLVTYNSPQCQAFTNTKTEFICHSQCHKCLVVITFGNSTKQYSFCSESDKGRAYFRTLDKSYQQSKGETTLFDWCNCGNTARSEEEEGTSISGAAIVAIVLLIVLISTGVIILLCSICKNKPKNSQKQENQNNQRSPHSNRRLQS